MAYKNQQSCYRQFSIKGKSTRLYNWSDLIMEAAEQEKIIREAKRIFKYVRIVKHHSGAYRQLFVSTEDRK
jgi:hypothetical protein